MKGLTPMMQQYFAIKENHKDHILFYRLGDFYEMFFDDAIVASKELELTLTGRDCGLKERAPMCGVPYHSAEGYIAKLIKKGYKVAVCEQTEEASQAKGLVTREVVRVITSGTLMEDNLLDEDVNNFLCAVYSCPQGFGLACADISTGEVNLVETDSDQGSVVNELTRYSPREIVFNPDFVDKTEITSYVREKLLCTADLLDEEAFQTASATKRILEHFQKESLEALDMSAEKLYVNALGALLHYLEETQKTGIERLITVNIQQEHRYMNLDLSARTNLELVHTLRTREKRGSLLWVLDKTQTPMGKRLIRSYMFQPLLNPLDIEKRLNAVEELFNDELFSKDLEDLLSGIYDVERLITRVVYGSATPREYKSLEQTINNFAPLKEALKNVKSENLKAIYSQIDPLEDLTKYLDTAIMVDPPMNLRDGGVIKDGFNAELDELRDLMGNVRVHLTKLEEKEKEITGIKNLKVGYNRIFGYYFEITRSNLEQVPDYFVRKQTLVNSERFITQELKELEDKIFHANEKAVSIENRLFEEIRQYTITKLHRIQQSAIAIARLDVHQSFALVSRENHYVRPRMEMSDKVLITQGRHPVVEKMLKGSLFVPNDTVLDTNENQIAIITGPNMAGKSTYMRQVAIIVLMAQIGCFVPADLATIGIVDGIYTRIGASDDLTAGDSTFMVEMKEMAGILKSATSKSLIILDEIGRGTSTYDGMSIARAVVEYTADKKRLGAKTLFATHYHELTSMEESVNGVKNYNIVAKKRGDDIIFLRRIVRGGADDSYGIEVSKLAGVPNWIIKRAHEVLVELESNEPKPIAEYSINKEPQATQVIPLIAAPVIEMLENIDVDTLTPIEAMNTLYKIKEIYDNSK